MPAMLVSAVRLASAKADSAEARADARSPSPPLTASLILSRPAASICTARHEGAYRVGDLDDGVARPDRPWRAAPIHQAARLAWISPRSTSASAICTAFKAAPLRRLSETHQKARPFGTV